MAIGHFVADVRQPDAHLGPPRVAAGDHLAADPAEGDPPSRRCPRAPPSAASTASSSPTTAAARSTAPSRRSTRSPPSSTRSATTWRPLRQRHPLRRRRLQGAGARRQRRPDRPPLHLGPRARGRGGRRDGAEDAARRARHDPRAQRAHEGDRDRPRLARARRARLITPWPNLQSDEARGHPPHHRDHRRRAAQRRLLRRRARAAARQEDGQPGPAERLPPLLRRRGRAAPAPTSPSSSSPARRPEGPAPAWSTASCGASRSEDAIDFWAGRLSEKGVETSRENGPLIFSDPEGLEHELLVPDVPDAPLTAEHPEIPAEHALQGFHAARAYIADPDAGRELFEEALAFEPRETARGRPAAPTAAASTSPTSPPPAPASRAPAACTTSRGRRTPTTTRRGATA